GVVIDGQERCFLQENPWNRIAYVEARSAIEIFNRGQYGNAAAIMKSLADRVTEDLTSRLFSSLSEVFEGFYQWDIFNHQRAKNILHKNINTLCLLADGQQVLFPELREFSASVKELVETLDGISDGRQGLALVYDLLANAKRRADLEKKYEDATARCYSAIEKSAHYDLSHNCGIDAGNAKPEAIPDKYREEYRRRYEITVREPGRQVVRRIQFGLAATMELLRHYERPIGLRFTERKKLIKEHLAERNKSILAHGSQPISYQRYRDLFEDALYLLKIDESDLTQFPQL
ncbi:MAG TPA: TIGR02710 family CRISPR-associated CARF protein, partial [Acidobacteriota bacterium]|nr:TIGR02710 family CRISPR-associated CARF protein [Acidobacteriota bacterium]